MERQVVFSVEDSYSLQIENAQVKVTLFVINILLIAISHVQSEQMMRWKCLYNVWKIWMGRNRHWLNPSKTEVLGMWAQWFQGNFIPDSEQSCIPSVRDSLQFGSSYRLTASVWKIGDSMARRALAQLYLVHLLQSFLNQSLMS